MTDTSDLLITKRRKISEKGKFYQIPRKLVAKEEPVYVKSLEKVKKQKIEQPVKKK